ncbi:hypothetical protein SELMODRAFT_140331 [Selaginella moellendorffii]|uniref:Uncharacterized protein n=1 Tax=Selaginella moellendorffii TaxID=88036 RepID=D8QTI3_SELML|nr:hypothetical protein SELMODRAFT_140331 [Selaginella moellendorffii]
MRMFCSESDAVPVQDAVLKAISEVSRADNRVSRTTNVVMGGTVVDEWQALDSKVNTYPMERGFTAIGTGGDDFVRAMVLAVETVLQISVSTEEISSKLSSQGKYISVKIGPVAVQSSEQVRAVYNAMRCDSRMKYFL